MNERSTAPPIIAIASAGKQEAQVGPGFERPRRRGTPRPRSTANSSSHRGGAHATRTDPAPATAGQNQRERRGSSHGPCVSSSHARTAPCWARRWTSAIDLRGGAVARSKGEPNQLPLQIGDDQPGDRDGHGRTQCARHARRSRGRSIADQQHTAPGPPPAARGSGESARRAAADSRPAAAHTPLGREAQTRPADEPRGGDRHVAHRLHRFDRANGLVASQTAATAVPAAAGEAQRERAGRPDRERQRQRHDAARGDSAAATASGAISSGSPTHRSAPAAAVAGAGASRAARAWSRRRPVGDRGQRFGDASVAPCHSIAA